MNKTASKVTGRWWILLSVSGALGCDRAADLGAYIGGHGRSTPSGSASSTPAAAVQPESLPRPVADRVEASEVAAMAPTVASATPSHSSPSASLAPAVPVGVAVAPSGHNEQGGNPRGTVGPAERAAPHTSTEAAPAVSAKPTEAPSPPTQKAGVVRNASIGGGSVFGGNVSSAARVIAGLRAAIRSCYVSDPASADGGLRLKLVLGPSGTVTSVSSTRSSGVHGGPGPSDRVAACTASVAQHAQFAPPENGKAEITFPVTFYEQEAMPPKRTTL
jgi:hypothetical protein